MGIGRSRPRWARWRTGTAAVVVLGAVAVSSATPAAVGAPTAAHRRTATQTATAPAVAGAPSAPAAPTASAGNAQVALRWVAPAPGGAAITGYEVTATTGGVAGAPLPFASTATAQTITRLTNGAAYTFTVVAISSLGRSPASRPSAAVVVGVPSAPGLPATTPGTGFVTLRWGAPAANGSPITGYLVTPRKATTVLPAQRFGSTVTTQQVVGLADGASYSFTVAAFNSYGIGPPSWWTAPVVPGAPATPTGVRAALDGTGWGALITWTAPTTGVLPVTGYVVTPYLGAIAQPALPVKGLAVSLAVPKLATGSAYTFKVAAANAAYTSPASTASALVTTKNWFCLPAEPATAAELATALNHHDPRWQGADGAHRVPLRDGRIVWLFGDSIYGTVQPDGTLTTGWGMAHGSMIIERGGCFDPFYSASTPSPTSVVPTTRLPSDEFYWPGAGWASPDGKTLNVMVSHVRSISTPPGFIGLDNGIAIYQLPTLAFVRVDPLPAPPAGTAAFWKSVPFYDQASGYVQIFVQNGFPQWTVRFLASTTSFTTATGWQYWTGAAWSPLATDIKPMSMRSAPLTGMSVMKTPSGYVGVANGLSAANTVISGWTSAGSAGPWAPLGTIGTATHAGGSSVSYGPHAVTVGSGKQFIIWSTSAVAHLSTIGAGFGVIDPAVPLG
ncbi:MAG: hypothetical protein JWN46_1322 [Acidimicrobiales bacterium]|nr:hypothetical protein [Acidimicrobiales bacterium]